MIFFFIWRELLTQVERNVPLILSAVPTHIPNSSARKSEHHFSYFYNNICLQFSCFPAVFMIQRKNVFFFPSPQCCPSADDTWIMLDNVIEQIISEASLALCNMIYTAWSCTEIINWKLVAVNWSSSKGPYDAPLLCWTIPCQTNVNLWNGAFTPGWSLNTSQCIYKVLFLFKALEKKNLHIPASSKYYM